MLPKSRLFSALLVGLGVALIVAGLVAPRFLLGDGRFPLDLENTTYTLVDDDARFEDESTPVTRQMHLEIQNPADDEMVSLRMGNSLFHGEEADQLDNLVTAETWSWQMNRVTGDPLDSASLSSVMVMPATKVDMGGPWIKLPVENDADEVNLFDPMLRRTAPAVREGEHQLLGRQADSYAQTIEPTNLAREYAAMQNTKTVEDGEGNAQQLYLTYEAKRVLTVDHITGLVIGITEDVDMYYADADGNRVENYVTYAAETSGNDARMKQLERVASQGTSRNATIVVMTLGGVLTLLGLIGAFRPEGRRKS
ncbi:DUF3068 domain-containing protein [Corynebacterium breve]|uniref:DUF3068 domain-containing protein n=1 Tax=Corynebacterium breve TaxID=3049799 RepID=A0ABY8VEH9_9CORY|nr:DUF3068 domain-containing protein [Corynebacterium breve]WIM68066.1 DUF3068 domain-containing protein [Corynebacterium breve]